VHLVSSFLSPLSLSLSFSFSLSPSLAFSALKGGWGRGGGRAWEGMRGEGEAVEAVTMVTMPRQIFIKSFK